jgi:hypothetical protein
MRSIATPARRIEKIAGDANRREAPVAQRSRRGVSVVAGVPKRIEQRRDRFGRRRLQQMVVEICGALAQLLPAEARDGDEDQPLPGKYASPPAEAGRATPA